MPYRAEKVNNLIKKILAGLIAKDFCQSREVIISLTRVAVTGNLQQAKVFISVLPDEKRAAVVASLNREVIFFQKALNKQLRMRPVPRIVFVEDLEPVKAQKVETALEAVKKTSQS